eukprot:CAMPEP_0197544222 /NCGR_PEP_ID=MMETSP1318-20131121/68653_1 /TAXON_ID=552666 /ORGANISM="Partenskyella glossopodia, Strain RCC365" /LENGTH=383 /DNA_ID=CAMNT_0043103603 /DNA_START=17 /DNA_END=1165 /DNA_ORIENTATION=+
MFTSFVKNILHGNKSNPESEREFAEKYADVVTIEKHLQQFYDHVQSYLAALQQALSTQNRVSGDLLYFFDGSSTNRKHADKYHGVCNKMQSSLFASFSLRISEDVLEPLATLLQVFPKLKALVKKRKKKLEAVEHYRKQVLHLARNAKTKNPERFMRKKDKLAKLDATFTRIHTDLTSIFDKYSNEKGSIMAYFTYKIMAAQKAFNSNTSADMEPLDEINGVFLNVSDKKVEEIEALLRNLVDQFQCGEYAADATNINFDQLQNRAKTRGNDADSPANSRGASPRAETKELFEYNNPIFDPNLPFEMRHKVFAPSHDSYLLMRESAPDVSSGPDLANSAQEETLPLQNTECVVYGYIGAEEGELSLEPGALIDVIERKPGGWW